SPGSAMEHLRARLSDAVPRPAWMQCTLRLQFDIVRQLARCYRPAYIVSLFPPVHRELFEELLHEPCNGRGQEYVDAMVNGLVEHGRDLNAVRAASRLVRNLSVAEIGVAGHLGDSGRRLDRV